MRQDATSAARSTTVMLSPDFADDSSYTATQGTRSRQYLHRDTETQSHKILPIKSHHQPTTIRT